MKNVILLSLFSIFLLACHHSPAEKPPKADLRYRTTVPSLLYFKNMRSFYYDQKVVEGSRMDRYRLRQFETSSQRPILYPIIVNNWMEDEAYILIEKNEYDEFSAPLLLRWLENGKYREIRLTPKNKEGQYLFASEINKALLSGVKLEIKTIGDQFVPIFQNKKDRSNFLLVIRDFFKLTEKKET